MNQLLSVQGSAELTMSSQEIADLLETRHDSVKRTVKRLAKKAVIQLPPLVEVANHLGQGVEEYRIGKRDSYVVVAQLSPEFTARLVDRWQQLETSLPVQRPLTTAESFLQIAQMQVEAERRHAEQAEAIQAINLKVVQIEQAQTVMSSCPANAESISHIRKRIGNMFGLSANIIDAVVREGPYAPKPAGTVRNGHEAAENSTYVVWWKKDVTTVFKRFADECRKETPTRYSHPFVQGRFHMFGDRGGV